MNNDSLTSITIRRAESGQAQTLTRIVFTAKRHWGYPEETMRLWEKDLTISAEFIRKNPVYYAVLDGRIVGVCSLLTGGETWEVEDCWVLPPYMGRGVGRRMFEHLLKVAREAGRKRLIIVSGPNAEGFYLKMGARRVGEVPSNPKGRILPLLEMRLEP